MPSLMPNGKQQYFNAVGQPLAGGRLYTYAAGTTTPQNTFSDAAGSVPNANPIILDARGEALVYWSGSYKVALQDASGTSIYTVDNYACGVDHVVASIAGLRALLKTSASKNAIVTGYYSAGDGGGGTYWYDSTDTTTADNGGTVIVASDGGRWKLVYSSFVTTKQFGAKADWNGTTGTDDTAAIQSACTNVQHVRISAAAHKVTEAITVPGDNKTISGEGQLSRIVTNHATADVFTVGNGSSTVLNPVFRDFSIDSSVAKSAGYAINARFAARARITNVFMSPPEFVATSPNLKHGIYFDRFDYPVVDGCQIIVSGIGISARGNADQSWGAGLYIGGGTKISTNNVAGSIGALIGGACGGIVFSDCDIINCENNVQLDTSLQTGINNREVFFTAGCTLDGAGFCGLYVKDNGAVQLDISGTWIASSGVVNAVGSGVLISSTQQAGMCASLTGVRAYNNAGGGIICNGGGLVITGGLFRMNGKGASGGHGIDFPTANSSGITISGAQIVDNGIAAKGDGIFIQVGVVNTNIQGNTVRNNTQGQITDGSGAVNKLIQNNLTT